MKTELWKPIVGFENIYSVSNYGRIRREISGRFTYSGKILKRKKNPDGYPIIHLCKNKKVFAKAIHKLETTAFLGKCPEGKQVNHIDNNKSNNELSNLEYVTASQNMRYARRDGLFNTRGVNNGQAKLNDKQIIEIRKLLNKNIFTQGEIGKQFSVSQTVIGSIKHNRTWTHIPL